MYHFFQQLTPEELKLEVGIHHQDNCHNDTCRVAIVSINGVDEKFLMIGNFSNDTNLKIIKELTT